MNSKRTYAATLSTIMIIASMLMMAITSVDSYAAQKSSARKKAAYYVCVMDPEIKSRTPGKCAKCGMTLRAERSEPRPATPADLSDKAATDRETVSNLSSRIPNTTVYNQDGKRLNFYTDLVKGKTVAINFIFTTCTTICPPMTATFRKVQQELGNRVGGEIEMISISVDPATDVPARMKDYTNKFNVGPGWTFVTGSKLEINELLKALGGYASDRNDHTPIILVGNERAGYWTRTYGLASPAAIVSLINQAAAKGGERSGKVGTTDADSDESDAAMRVPLPGETGTAAAERQVEKRASTSTAIPSSTKTEQPGSEGDKGEDRRLARRVTFRISCCSRRIISRSVSMTTCSRAKSL